MQSINPYLNFDGKCREAMTHYHACLGGDLSLMTVGGSPMEGEMKNVPKDHILHGALKFENGTIMGSDMSDPANAGRRASNSVVIECSGEEEIKVLFAKLAEGASVTCPLGDAFWGGIFGALTDPFGVNWMLAYTRP